jgi:hypothetical protein
VDEIVAREQDRGGNPAIDLTQTTAGSSGHGSELLAPSKAFSTRCTVCTASRT